MRDWSRRLFFRPSTTEAPGDKVDRYAFITWIDQLNPELPFEGY
jgi:hypothetical protein